MFHQESELPLASDIDFFGSLYSVDEKTYDAILYVRVRGLLEPRQIKLVANNRDRMCNEYDYGGLHHEPPHLPMFYKKDRYDKNALRSAIEITEKKYGNN